MADVVVTMSADESRLFRAQQKLIAQEAKMAKGYEKVGKSGAKAKRELEKFADKTKRIDATSAERYKTTVEKLDRALKAGLLTQQEYNRAVKRAGGNIRGSFGASALGQLRSFALGYVSVSQAMRLVGSAAQFIAQENQAAVQSLKAVGDQARQLNQIANSAEDLEALEKGADDLALKHGVDRNVARQVFFTARSEGFSGQEEEILRLNEVLDPAVAAKVTGQIPKLFPGQLTGEQARNMTFVASRQSPLNFEEIAQALPSISEGASLAGSSPAETLALTSVLASRFKSGSSAADRGKAFGTKVGIDKRLKGMGIIDAFLTVRDEFTEEERDKFLGESQELNSFFNVLNEELDTVLERRTRLELAQQRAGAPESELEKAVFRGLTNEKFNLRRGENRSELRRTIARENHLAEGGSRGNVAFNNLIAEHDELGRRQIEKYAAFAVGGLTKLAFGDSPEAIAGTGIAASRFASKFTTLGNPNKLFGSAEADAAQGPESPLAKLLGRVNQAMTLISLDSIPKQIVETSVQSLDIPQAALRRTQESVPAVELTPPSREPSPQQAVLPVAPTDDENSRRIVAAIENQTAVLERMERGRPQPRAPESQSNVQRAEQAAIAE